MKIFIRPLIGFFIGYNLAHFFYRLYSGTLNRWQVISHFVISVIVLSFAFLLLWGIYYFSIGRGTKK